MSAQYVILMPFKISIMVYTKSTQSRYAVALGVGMGFPGIRVRGKALYFSVPAHSLFSFEPPVGDAPDGVEFAWTSGLKLLIVIFFVIFFLLYVLVLINGERRPAAPHERQAEHPTSRMAASEPQPRHHARTGGRSGTSADHGPRAAAASEPDAPGTPNKPGAPGALG